MWSWWAAVAVLCPGKFLVEVTDSMRPQTRINFFFFASWGVTAFFPVKLVFCWQVQLHSCALLVVGIHRGIPAEGGNYLIALIWAWVQLQGRHSAAGGGVVLCSCPKSACFALGRLDAVHKTLRGCESACRQQDSPEH